MQHNLFDGVFLYTFINYVNGFSDPPPFFESRIKQDFYVNQEWDSNFFSFILRYKISLIYYSLILKGQTFENEGLTFKIFWRTFCRSTLIWILKTGERPSRSLWHWRIDQSIKQQNLLIRKDKRNDIISRIKLHNVQCSR